jgi:hypothetical protein
MKTLAAVIPLVVLLSACENRLVESQSQYSYSFLPASETYLSTRRLIGEIYAFDPADPDARLVQFDRTVTLAEDDLASLVPVTATSSRVIGADLTVTLSNGNALSGSSEFEAVMLADGLAIRSASAARTSDRIQDLYARLRSEAPNDPVLPLRAREVDRGELLYAVISGAGDANKVELRHGTPAGQGAGVTLTIAGQQVADVRVARNDVFTCEKSEDLKPRCTVDITIYGGRLVTRGGDTFFDVSPTSVDKQLVTRVFQNTFSN